MPPFFRSRVFFFALIALGLLLVVVRSSDAGPSPAATPSVGQVPQAVGGATDAKLALGQGWLCDTGPDQTAVIQGEVKNLTGADLGPLAAVGVIGGPDGSTVTVRDALPGTLAGGASAPFRLSTRYDKPVTTCRVEFQDGSGQVIGLTIQ